MIKLRTLLLSSILAFNVSPSFAHVYQVWCTSDHPPKTDPGRAYYQMIFDEDTEDPHDVTKPTFIVLTGGLHDHIVYYHVTAIQREWPFLRVTGYTPVHSLFTAQFVERDWYAQEHSAEMTPDQRVTTLNAAGQSATDQCNNGAE